MIARWVGDVNLWEGLLIVIARSIATKQSEDILRLLRFARNDR